MIHSRKPATHSTDERPMNRPEASPLPPGNPLVDDVLTTLEAAQLLKRTPATLRRWRTAGEGPPWVRIGSSPKGRCLYLRRHIDSWLDANTYTSTADETVRRLPGQAS